MAYELINTETIAENIRRILKEEIAGAIYSLENPGGTPDASIHDVRKRLKKIRALLRLVRNEIGLNLFRQENIRYRNIAHMLAHVRDATVMIHTLDRLKDTYQKAIPTAAYNKARQALVYREVQLSKAFFAETNTIQQVLDAFRDARQNQPELPLKRDSFAVFAGNLLQIYKRGIKAFDFAVTHPSIESYHELRKEVKHLWYHTRLLTPVWPGVFQAIATELGTLSELLGDDHDLGVLYEEIESGKLPFYRKATAEKMLHLISEQRKDLQQQIYPVGQRIFAEKPEDFTARYRLYWNIWRKEKNAEQVSISTTYHST